MPKWINLKDEKVPGWIVESYDFDSVWNLRCVTCGLISKIGAKSIRKKVNIACRMCGKTHRLVHGHSMRGKSSGTYLSWKSMKQRCKLKPGNKDYHLYSGRGIKMCDRWNSFSNFLEDMGERPDGKYNLDRIDNSLGYFKENCRWATSQENQRNRRNNTWAIFNGEKMVLSQIVQRTGMKKHLISSAIKSFKDDVPDITERLLASGKPIPIAVVGVRC